MALAREGGRVVGEDLDTVAAVVVDLVAFDQIVVAFAHRDAMRVALIWSAEVEDFIAADTIETAAIGQYNAMAEPTVDRVVSEHDVVRAAVDRNRRRVDAALVDLKAFDLPMARFDRYRYTFFGRDHFGSRLTAQCDRFVWLAASPYFELFAVGSRCNCDCASGFGLFDSGRDARTGLGLCATIRAIGSGLAL